MLLNRSMILRYLLKGRPIPRIVARSPFWEASLPRINRAAMSTSSAPKLQHVAIHTEEGIAIIKYNRPKNGNALNTPTLKVSCRGAHSCQSCPSTFEEKRFVALEWRLTIRQGYISGPAVGRARYEYQSHHHYR